MGIGEGNLCQYVNEIMVFIDGFNVYGFDLEVFYWLCIFLEGKLKVLMGNCLLYNIISGEFEDLIDLDVLYMDNFIGIFDVILVVGDFWVGENLFLISLYIFFVCEYNWQCDIILKDYFDWMDE